MSEAPTVLRHEGPPLWHAAVMVPVALGLAIFGPDLVGQTWGPGLGTSVARLMTEVVAFGLGVRGWYSADVADVRPSVHDENTRIVLVFGGLLAAMFAGALGWLAFMDVLSSL